MRLGASIAALETTNPNPEPMLTAADVNYQAGAGIWTFDVTTLPVTRAQAMTVPAVARARNIICGTFGSLPVDRFSIVTGAEISDSPLCTQPDPASPKSVTYSWLADSMLFYGVGYVQVLETYQNDGRPARWRWIDPMRITPQYNQNQTMIVGYQLDGLPMPLTGVGEIKAFPLGEEGLLNRAARTLRTAIELEAAAYRSAVEPIPTTVLQSTGVDLPAERVTALLQAWKAARSQRQTAYVSSGLKMEAVGFSPEQLQLVAARQFMASEIARAVGIPAWYLNAESASATYSNVESERRSLVDFSLRPIISAFEDRMSMDDISSRAVEFKVDLDDFLRGSTTERVKIAIDLATAGLIDNAEARKLLDLYQESPNVPPVQ